MAHTYWRLRFFNNAARISQWINVVGLQMRDTMGGPNVATGGTAIAGSSTAPKVPADAFLSWTSDDPSGNYWATNNGDWYGNWWVGYQFAAPVEIEEITLTGVRIADYNPGYFSLDYSDDGLTWTNKYFWDAAVPWTLGGVDNRVFNATNDIAEDTNFTQVPQGQIIATVRQAAVAAHMPQFGGLVTFNVPSENLAMTQGQIAVSVRQAAEVDVGQGQVLVAARGRIGNPRVRAWTFSLDGHDFYVLRLGDKLTLVYDLYSEQWMDWADFAQVFWRANIGINWTGGIGLAAEYGSNIIVGDDVYGLIWFLDPDQPFDQHPDYLNYQQEMYFERIVMGQVPIRGREVVPCFAAWLTTDMGNPAYLGAGVTLYTSDDGGETFDDHGLVTVTPGEFNPELSWYSLGQIGAPGRLFKIVDDGAIVRIDGMEMNDPDDDG